VDAPHRDPQSNTSALKPSQIAKDHTLTTVPPLNAHLTPPNTTPPTSVPNSDSSTPPEEIPWDVVSTMEDFHPSSFQEPIALTPAGQLEVSAETNLQLLHQPPLHQPLQRELDQAQHLLSCPSLLFWLLC